MALPLRLVAYVNGVRFWLSDVSVSAPGDDLPSFAFGIPAVPEWTLLPERSHVAIFFSDPVTKLWRLLIEGETVGWSRQRLATGVRRMSIQCRALHAFWETTRYANAAATFAQDTGQQTGTVDLYRQAQINGVSVDPSTNAHFQLNSLSTIIADSLGPSTRISEFLMTLLPRVTLQTPVECYYAQARGVSKKMFAFIDEDIVNAASQYVFKSLVVDKLNGAGLGPMDPIKTVYARYEGAIFYRHTGVLSPPIYANEVMPELLFLPDLYNVVPPACNVIFRDQIQASNPERSFMAEPTRVVGVLQYGAGDGALPPYYLVNNSYESPTFNDQNTPANQVTNGMTMTHGALTEEELIGGVRLHHVRLPFEKVTQTGGDAEKVRLSTYIDVAMRHTYSVERGAARVSVYHCSFLPYVQPGFPCLIEDGDMPVHGFIDRVEHQLSSESQPITLITVSHVREAYQIAGRNRTAPLPTWLNRRFLPKNIDDTYRKLFGPNQGQEVALPSSGAMLPASRITTQTTPRVPKHTHSDQVDMDALAGQILPVPKYSEQYVLQGPVSAMCVADRLRSSADPMTSMLAYQYRSGTSLWQYSKMHNLDSANAYMLRPDAALFQQVTTTDDSSSVDNASIDPPADLSPTTAQDKDSDGHPCFGHPLGLKMSRSASAVPIINHPPGQSDTQYGVYDLVAGGFLTRALISPQRQIIARAIAAALKNGISST